MIKNGWVFKGFSHQNKLNLEPTKPLVWPQKPNLGPQKTKQTSEPNQVRPDTTTQRNIPKMFASFCTIPCKCRDTLNLKKIFSKINELVTPHIWGCSGLILAGFFLHIAQYTKMLNSIRLGPFFDSPFCFDFSARLLKKSSTNAIFKDLFDQKNPNNPKMPKF